MVFGRNEGLVLASESFCVFVEKPVSLFRHDIPPRCCFSFNSHFGMQGASWARRVELENRFFRGYGHCKCFLGPRFGV